LEFQNIIFDFDGVLAESVHIKTRAFFKLYEKYGKEIADKVVEHHKANGGMSRFDKFPYYHKHFLNIELTNGDVEILSNDFSNMVIKNVVEADEVSGASWFLKKYFSGRKFWIVSATPTEEIREISEKRKIANFFIDIFGSPRDKLSWVKEIIIKHKLEKNATIFIGDALSDFKAAEDNGIHFILRRTQENKDLFEEHSDIICFTDYYELDLLLGNQI